MIDSVSRMNTVIESVVAFATCSVLYVSRDSSMPEACRSKNDTGRCR